MRIAAIRLRPASALLALLLVLAVASPAAAQSSRDAQRRLDTVKRELRDVASERRRLEGQRGAASRELRSADERVARVARELRDTETALARQQAALATLVTRRDALAGTLSAQRKELAGLLRAAYTVGDHAPLKLLLAQDDVAAANRSLAYHGYLQRGRSARIAALSEELAGLDAMEREIASERAALDASQVAQRAQVAALERERASRAESVAALDTRYRDRSAKEKALGADAKSLERLLARLREAARRAEAERRAAAAAAARAKTATAEPGRAGTARSPVPSAPKVSVARAAPVAVGGLGWPLSGSLLAGYGGRMPDGRRSSGVLIAAAAGQPVTAVADGTVVFSEWMTGYGMILIVDHGNAYMSLYAHNDALLKGPGDRVKRGDAVATVGTSGGQGQPALYFELRRDGKPVDPSSWLQKR
ncbi:peptidoglycan DD-metalloendopeptidase family protein [Luteimonas sp. MC1572]|uniref:murein hydrolase activator EnvC family protein n=1 Tax=Luteimonas sp. MC1572 TaxID=2799325 RepID=UPI0018F0A5F4|nr:peptidoglycan DD-metalloendopeptidase family protein [Luteimonas sp. MC1572]MBJ6982117.1 peptidoglycan DD-metalloendopeptidase family protein [Luteimonas sp. MC1572]QQO04445.1 peptidoglycan DD-metalloendopeptidase family protein [Luteimonas sp. MC1572]